MQSFDNLEQLWELIFKSISGELSDLVMEVWLSKLTLIHLDDKSAILSTPSKIYTDIINDKFYEPIVRHFEEVIGFAVDVVIQTAISSDTEPEKAEPFEPVVDAEEIKTDETSENEVQLSPGLRYNNIGAEYTFENFIVGRSNDFAHAACVAVADNINNPSESKDQYYNPLFIYGPSGLGKTHLMYAITNKIRSKNLNAKIIYIKGEEFTNELIEAIAVRDTSAFKDKYRKVDVLLIDDIQFIAGKESTQEEFFHTFNTLYEDHKQIIFTSDRPPKEIKTLEDRIRSRFEWGVIADIQPPDFELRRAILKNKAKSMNLTVPDNVLEFLAEKLHSNIRQIEGAIKKLGAKSQLTGDPITVDLVKRSFPELIKENEPVETTIQRITNIVSKKYGVTGADIMSAKRSKEIAFARHITIYVTRVVTELSLPSLGKIFNRDHSTILSSCNVVEKDINTNAQLKADIDDIIREIKD